MGGKITKELGVYNEEEQICTPQGPQRYRLLNIDPRSATVGIIRTPIQVESTPISSKKISIDHVSQNNDNTFIDDEEINNVNNKEQCDEEKKSDSKDVSMDEIKTVDSEVKVFLETGVDKVDSSALQPDVQPIHKQIIELTDARSPSLQVTRTPVMVHCTPELFALHAQIENMSFCDFDSLIDEPSALVSDDDQSSHCTQSTVKNWLKDVEKETQCDPPSNNSFCDSPKTVAKKQKEINAMKKKLFFTPDLKEHSKQTPDLKEFSKPKVRTPLGNIQASQMADSPQKLVRSKQWRNIQEERQRRGIADMENTPPSLPPLSKISSAPGKIIDRRTRTLWDDDNTMVI